TARRCECGALLQSRGRDDAHDRYALPRHHAPSADHGPHGPPLWRDHGRARCIPARHGRSRPSRRGRPRGGMTDLSSWTERPRPARAGLAGRFARLEPLDATRHARALGAALAAPGMAAEYAYLWDRIPESAAEIEDWVRQVAPLDDPFRFAVIDRRSGKPEG